MALDKIQFQTNLPVELALKFTEGKLCDSQFGDPQYMFSTTDDRCFFVAAKVAQKIHDPVLLTAIVPLLTSDLPMASEAASLTEMVPALVKVPSASELEPLSALRSPPTATVTKPPLIVPPWRLM